MQKVETVRTDDLDGSAADSTIRFGLDGAEYEIDLNDEHASTFRESVQQYIAAARKVSGTRRAAGARPRRAPAGTDSTQVREWARSQGLPVKERGRVPSDLVARYRAATGAR
ncbi:MAG: histone-like nucleoid-structuring protein Lsr2 [Streptosporangiaceae bacterium]